MRGQCVYWLGVSVISTDRSHCHSLRSQAGDRPMSITIGVGDARRLQVLIARRLSINATVMYTKWVSGNRISDPHRLHHSPSVFGSRDRLPQTAKRFGLFCETFGHVRTVVLRKVKQKTIKKKKSIDRYESIDELVNIKSSRTPSDFTFYRSML